MLYVVIAGLFDCVISVFAMSLYIYFGKNKNQYELLRHIFLSTSLFRIFAFRNMCKSNIYGRKWLRDKYNPLGLPWKEQWSVFYPFTGRAVFSCAIFC